MHYMANKNEGSINSLHKTGNGISIHMEPESISDSPDCGNLCFSVGGDGEKSYITAEYHRFMREYIASSELGVSQESVLFGFREKGRLPDSTVGKKPQAVPDDFSKLSDAELDSLFRAHSEYPFADSLLSRIRHTKPDFPSSREEKINDYCITAKPDQLHGFGCLPAVRGYVPACQGACLP